MRNGGGALLTVGIVLTVVASATSKSQRVPSRPTSYGPLPRSGVKLPPIPFTPVPGRPVMTGTFCAQCGTQGRPGDACCRRCGAGKSNLVVQPFQEIRCPSCGSVHTAPIEQYCRQCGEMPA